MNIYPEMLAITSSRGISFGAALKKGASLVLAIALVFVLTFFLLFIKQPNSAPDATQILRSIDVALPTPPPPPPPEVTEIETSAVTPTLNFSVGESALSLSYSEKPRLSQERLVEVEQPEFDISDINPFDTLALTVPTIAVENLDTIPKVVSYKFLKIPPKLTRKGIYRVETRVLLIIDIEGKAYVRKIVDPVYPQMEPIIREWVEHVKFTVPRKDGKAVQASYLYYINFNYRGR